MSTRTSLLTTIAVVLVTESIFVFTHRDTTELRSVDTVPASVHTATSTSVASPPVATTTTATTALPKQNSVTLVIAGSSYPVAVSPGETVLEAMRSLSSQGTITFTGRDYPGLGLFVDSINGEKNTGGRYWVFYVNGVSATQGVSTQQITTGDLIEWKYEKSY